MITFISIWLIGFLVMNKFEALHSEFLECNGFEKFQTMLMVFISWPYILGEYLYDIYTQIQRIK